MTPLNTEFPRVLKKVFNLIVAILRPWEVLNTWNDVRKVLIIFLQCFKFGDKRQKLWNGLMRWLNFEKLISLSKITEGFKVV